jgi:hypothetical protein
MSLIEHLERHCGEIAGGWQEDADGNQMPCQIVRLPTGPVPGTAVVATLGLSKHVLHGWNGKEFRLELFIVHRTSEGTRNLPGVLQQVVMGILRNHHGPSSGDVIGPFGPLREGASVEALYVTEATCFPESFAFYDPGDGSLPIVMAWLVPITASEAAFVKRVGWERFEDELERQKPNFLSFERRSIELDDASSESEGRAKGG